MNLQKERDLLMFMETESLNWVVTCKRLALLVLII